MAFAAPALAAVGGGSALLGGATVLSALGTGFGAIQQMQQASFQQEVAERNATLQEQQAVQAQQRGAIEAQENDFAALQQMSQMEARRAGSGFELGSTSFNRSRRLERMLATRDRLRINDNAEREALTLKNQAASSRTEAEGFGMTRRNTAIGGVFDLGSDLISSASLVNKRKAAQLKLEN